MKTFFYLILPLFFLISCGVTRVEIYYVERYPVQWEDTVYFKPDHWHYNDNNDIWYCVEIEADTFVLDIRDTINVPILMCSYKKREHHLRWDLKNLNDESNNCCK
jgi:hypothetical protein